MAMPEMEVVNDDIYKHIAKLTALQCDVSMSCICLSDGNHIWVKAAYGLDDYGSDKLSNLLDYALSTPTFLEVENIAKNKTISNIFPSHKIEFYAQAILYLSLIHI